MSNRQGNGTILFQNRPTITAFGAYVGKKEKQGPLGSWFEHFDNDTSFQCDTWEKAEVEMQKRAYNVAIEQSDKKPDLIFGGDLLNQCVASAYAARQHGVPFFGLYGACSTMSESMALAAMAVDGGYAGCAAAMTSSHFCTAERQYRFPLEYGSHRPQSSQWTATGAGCVAVEQNDPNGVAIEGVCVGRVIDLGVIDMNNMGAAMAPAAADTLLRLFADTGLRPGDFDAVVSGDLGHIGSDILLQLCSEGGLELKNHLDCGKLLYDQKEQYVGSGGSGCGCSASVLCGHLLPRLMRGELRSIVFMATGALMSPTTIQQGESIPSIAHAVLLRK